jgi:predicted Fe-Mo cluster-binding NifX family protein
MLVDQGVDVLLLKESLEGKGPSYVLGDAGVEARITEATTLSEVLLEVGAESSSTTD